MDMWEPYIRSVQAHLTNPDEKIVFDRYHVMGYLNTAVDTVRKREHRALAGAGNNLLAGSKYLWLYTSDSLPERHTERLAALRAVDLKTGRAWAIKENLRHFWVYQRRGWGEKHWRKWYFWATHSRLKPVIDAAHTLKRHEAGLGDKTWRLPTKRRRSHTEPPRSSPSSASFKPSKNSGEEVGEGLSVCRQPFRTKLPA